MRDGSEVRTSRNAGCDVVAPAVRSQGSLAFLVEAATGTPHPLSGRLTTIGRTGRGDSGSVAIADPYLSREHAQILMHDGHCWLVDLDSANGSFVNSRPIDGPTPLAPGDTLSLGTTSLLFMVASTPPSPEEDRRG